MTASRGAQLDSVAAWLEAHRDDLIAYLVSLVRIPSDNPPGDCSAIADRVQAEFEQLGLETERCEVPRQNGFPAPTVLGWLGPRTAEPAILLNAHADVIPPGEGWTVDPYGGVVVDGRLIGRGAAVSKSDVAAYTYAVAAVRDVLGTPGQSSVVAITADEESGGALGPRWLLDERGLRPRRVICAGFSHSVIVAHNGCVQGRILVRGQSAHAATPWLGVDALRLTSRLLVLLYEEDAALRACPCEIDGIRFPTLTVSRVMGGDAQGTTAASAEIWIDRRVIPSGDPQVALEQIQALVARFNGDSDGSAEFEPTLVVQPLPPSAHQSELVDLVRREGVAVLGHEFEAKGVPIFTDARWFAAAGVPTVIYGAGPADPAEARGHAADENVAIADLVAAAEIVARVVLRILAGGQER